MNILVCIKQVVDTAEIKVDSAANVIDTSRAPLILNPYDANALEAAVQLKEAHGGTVTVLTMGADQSKAVLKESISVGADKAVLLSDAAFQDSDTYGTSCILVAAIRKLGEFDLILCGKQSIDGDAGQVGPQIAEQLDIPQITLVSKIQIDGQKIVADRDHEDGKEVIEATLPILCTITDTINKPRYATVKSKLAANKAQIEILTSADLPDLDQTMIGADGSPTRMLEVYAPPKKTSGIRIKEETAAASGVKLAQMLIAEKVI